MSVDVARIASYLQNRRLHGALPSRKADVNCHPSIVTAIREQGKNRVASFPTWSRRQRPDPALAEVQVAEEERLLELGRRG